MSAGLARHRDPAAVRAVAGDIARESATLVKIMEVCGSHSHCIARYGLRSLLPPAIELVPGPGCPVCVAPQGDINLAIDLALLPGVILASFGDLIRVPGSELSLAQARAEGADVRVVVSPMGALELAQAEPDSEVVFVGIGFETTAPGVAATVRAAHAEGLPNFSVLVAHKTMPAPMAALVADGQAGVNAFICPGHVSTIIGSRAYDFLANEHGVPCVIAGFEPLDVMLAIRAIVRQWERMARGDGAAEVEIEYSRAVRREGNRQARAIMDEVFEPAGSTWRGLGTIPASGLRLRPAYANYDAESRFGIARRDAPPHPACHCGDVLRGLMVPRGCPVFGKACTPDTPLGPCMVSSEGACAAEWLYRP